MGRKPLAALGPEQARQFRRLVREKLKKNKLLQRDLVYVSGAEKLSVRWIQNALSDRPLPTKTASEIVRRLVLADVVHSLQELIQFNELLPPNNNHPPRAALAILPNQSALLADALAMEATRVSGIGQAKRQPLAKRFQKYLLPYEEIFKPGPFQAGTIIMETMHRRYGPHWQGLFGLHPDLIKKHGPALINAARKLKTTRGLDSFERAMFEQIITDYRTKKE